jgi:hypothetical protein
MTKNEYNGWYNYETWAVNLWLDSEESSQNYWNERASLAYETAADSVSAYANFTGREIFSREERAVLALEKQLQSEHEEALPSLTGFAADLLNAAMSEVNWREIAQHLVEAAMESEAA